MSPFESAVNWVPSSTEFESPLSTMDGVVAAVHKLTGVLMVAIVVFQAGDGTHGAMPSDEYDGDARFIALEIDPWQ